MTALSKIQAAGFVVTLVNGSLNVTPTKTDLTDTQRIFIKLHKYEIVTQLTTAQLHHDRCRLENKPEISTSYCYRVIDKPDAVLTLNSRQPTAAAAKESLVQKYGARLIDFYPMLINY